MVEIETTVYIDVLFIFNAAVNYILLTACAHIGGFETSRVRMAAGAGTGALYACLMFFPAAGPLFSAVGKLCVCPLICLAAFGGPARTLLRKSLIFLVATCIFGGGVYLLRMLFADMATFIGVRNGIAYIDLPLPVTGLSFGVVYLLLSLVMRRVGTRPEKHTEKAEITFEGRKCSLFAAHDTGNNLRDPLSGARVMVCGFENVQHILPPRAVSLIKSCGGEAVSAMQLLAEGGFAGVFRLVPCLTATGRGMLLAFRPEKVILGGRAQKNLLVALARDGIDDGSGYQAVI